jgi:hypothetical protein
LSACWALERLGGDAARETARSLFGIDGEHLLLAAIANLERAVNGGPNPPPPPADMPAFLHAEVLTVQ